MNEATDEYDSKLLLGRYRVVRKLGQGGMGTVHLARLEGAEGFTKPVVVKRVRQDIKSSEEGTRLFKREAQILSNMHHPGIVNIIDFGVEDGAHIMVLEYVHGYTLAPWMDYHLRRNIPLPVDVSIYIVRKVLDALHYAHHFEIQDGQEVQVVHRDVAPDNVLLSKKGYVHLLDFGVASLSGMGRDNSTKSGVFRGKLGYAAPETVHGLPATPRSDLYSAAVMLLELLIRETPFLSESMGETIQRMVSEIPPAPSSRRDDIPEGLDEIIACALMKDPLARHESALAFSRELRRVQQADDDEVAQQLRRLVQEDFEHISEEVDVEPLRVREEALTRVFPDGHRAWTTDSLSGEEHQNETLSEVNLIAGAQTQSMPVAGADGQKGIRGILLGLLVVGGLIAVGLGAAVALLSRSGSGEQVVVVGGDNSPPTAESNSPQLADPVHAGRSADRETEQSPANVPPTETAGKDTPAVRAGGTLTHNSLDSANTASPRTVLDVGERQALLLKAVQGKASQFQACFAADLTAGGSTPQVTLHFSVAQGGGIAQVTVEPGAVEQSKLGGCLRQAASQIRFPHLGEAVSFRVPVKAYRTKQ